MKFQPNKQYVRDVLAQQVDWTADGTEYVPVSELPSGHRYHLYQQKVNSGMVPSREVIQQHVDRNGQDYRQETEGPHPVERFQDRRRAAA
jgi:hypothetical protein